MKQIRFVLLIIIAAAFLTGCSGSMLTGSSWPGIASDGEKVYLANSNTVTAINQETGSKIWSYPEKPDNKTMFYAAPAIAGDEIIVGDYTRSLHSLDTTNGNQTWVFNDAQGRYIASALVLDEYIIAPSSDHTLYVMDRMGNLKWEYTTGQMIWAQPVSDGEFIYAASMDHHLVALRLEDGKEQWDTELESAIIFSLTIDDSSGTLFVGTIGKKITAINCENGKTIWQNEAKDAVWAKPLYLNGNIYVGDLSGNVYSIDAESGKLNWTNSLQGAIVAAAVQVEDDLVFVTEDGIVSALNLEGGQSWQRTIEGNLYTSPVVLEDKLLIGVTAGDVVITAIDFNGNPIWTYSQ